MTSRKYPPVMTSEEFRERIRALVAPCPDAEFNPKSGSKLAWQRKDKPCVRQPSDKGFYPPTKTQTERTKMKKTNLDHPLKRHFPARPEVIGRHKDGTHCYHADICPLADTPTGKPILDALLNASESFAEHDCPKCGQHFSTCVCDDKPAEVAESPLPMNVNARRGRAFTSIAQERDNYKAHAQSQIRRGKRLADALKALAMHILQSDFYRYAKNETDNALAEVADWEQAQ